MELTISADTKLSPPNLIRVETALSRYPVHRLAKHGDIAINITEKDEHGELSIKWEVDYSKNHGQPGPLAYKLDTLIINRRIEEAGRPIPRIIRLGSLRDICRELGLSEGENINSIRKALRQNAFAGITAKIRYRQNNGGERTLEADFTRYHVVFTGEELPDGRKADAVYIILSDIYMQVINGAVTRPLDYDYLKSLPPASQRFYELLSYQIYAALKHDRPRARLAYSEFCTYAPQTRHTEWLRVRTQMTKVHRPHLRSGYLAEIDFQDTVDREGRPDWVMLYVPGPKARAEYRAFTRRGGPTVLEVEPFVLSPAPTLPAPSPSPLEAELIGRGITPAMAGGLVRDHGEETIRAQIEQLDWLVETKPKKVADPAAWLVAGIRNGHAAPKGFVPKAERERREAERQAQEREQAEQRRREWEQAARDRSRQQTIDAYLARLTPAERKALEAEALARADAEARQCYEEAAPARFRAIVLLNLVREHVAGARAGGDLRQGLGSQRVLPRGAPREDRRMAPPAGRGGLPVRPITASPVPPLGPRPGGQPVPTPRTDAGRTRMPERFHDWTLRQRAVYRTIWLDEVMAELHPGQGQGPGDES